MTKMVGTRLKPNPICLCVGFGRLQALVTKYGFTCMKKIHLNHFRLYLHGKGHKLDPNSYCLSYQVKHEANLRDPQNELWHAEFKLLGYPRKL